MELVQSLEKTPERSDPVETGTFWSDLIRTSLLGGVALVNPRPGADLSCHSPAQ